MLRSIALIVLVVYLAIGIFFAVGYRYTTFGKRRRKMIILSLLWLPLWVANARYRRNFRRSLKRSSDPW